MIPIPSQMHLVQTFPSYFPKTYSKYVIYDFTYLMDLYVYLLIIQIM